ncbi:MAG: DUF1398 family protein [Saprospiraceae bacterium]|nr:DUF1398 family protein [Saprospiraceae bacterium]
MESTNAIGAISKLVRFGGTFDHQQGKTDFLTFIKLCASYGIEKWAISMAKMTCTYYDKAGNEILVEKIPQ